MQRVTASSYQIIERSHPVLTGPARGMHVCVCLECGKLLGIVSSLRLLDIIESQHICFGPTAWLQPLVPPGAAGRPGHLR